MIPNCRETCEECEFFRMPDKCIKKKIITIDINHACEEFTINNSLQDLRVAVIRSNLKPEDFTKIQCECGDWIFLKCDIFFLGTLNNVLVDMTHKCRKRIIGKLPTCSQIIKPIEN